MIRRIPVITSSASLILAIATMAAWAWSERRADFVTWTRLTEANDPASDFVPMDRYYALHIGATAGDLVVGYGNAWEQPFRPRPRWEHTTFAPPVDYSDPYGRWWNRLGFTWDHGSPPDGLMDISFPCWAAAILLMILPAAWGFHRLKTGAAAAAGCCRQCGYDLRASNDRCPECGTPIPAPTEEATA